MCEVVPIFTPFYLKILVLGLAHFCLNSAFCFAYKLIWYCVGALLHWKQTNQRRQTPLKMTTTSKLPPKGPPV